VGCWIKKVKSLDALSLLKLFFPKKLLNLLIATQHNATQPAQHDKTPHRYEIDGRAGRSTKNSTEKFGQKMLQALLGWLASSNS